MVSLAFLLAGQQGSSGAFAVRDDEAGAEIGTSIQQSPVHCAVTQGVEGVACPVNG
ncbi:hypothetical protein [Streptomyces exfoliatus]|uniref:hypothetical protein n=1 Tax=Streptomyces exfoliatus TaxID=1905 RepID=UPI0004B9B53E|nr:hypothetical protein [Streptomyces exfoliatus]